MRQRRITQSDYKAAGRGLMRDCAEDIRRGLVQKNDREMLQELTDAAQDVINCWSSGNLALAINRLAIVIEEQAKEKSHDR